MYLLMKLLKLAGMGYFTVCLLIFILQKKMIYFPFREIEAFPSDIGLEYQNLTIIAADRTEINAWFLPCSRTDRVILFCHGNGGNISHRLDTMRIYNYLGYSSLFFDYRGYGKSTGDPDEKGMIMDGRACFKWLCENGFSPDKIIIAGRSLGGSIAAVLAAELDPAALILESTFTSVPDIAAKVYPWLPVRLLCRISHNTKTALKECDCPVLIAHSRDDEVVPFLFSQQLISSCKRTPVFLEMSGNHDSGFLDTGKKYTETLRHFLESITDAG